LRQNRNKIIRKIGELENGMRGVDNEQDAPNSGGEEENLQIQSLSVHIGDELGNSYGEGSISESSEDDECETDGKDWTMIQHRNVPIEKEVLLNLQHDTKA